MRISRLCCLGLLLLVVGSSVCAQPFFKIDRAAGPRDTQIAVRLTFFDGGLAAVASGNLVFAYDSVSLLAEDNCASSAGSGPFATHGVSCTIDSANGLITVAFSSTINGATLTGRRSMGKIIFTPVLNQLPASDPVLFDLPIVSTTFIGTAGGNIASGENKPGSVLLSDTWPVDGFEPDNSPIQASMLTDSRISTGPAEFLQLHSFHNEADEDWIYYDQPQAVGASCEPMEATIIVEPNLAFSSTFVPLLEVYGADRLTDANAAPIATLGDCGVATGPAPIEEMPIYLVQSRLFRVRNCRAPPPEGLGYTFRIKLKNCYQLSPTLVSGQVTEEGTNNPVRVFLLTDSNEFAVSDPDTGTYQMSTLANTEFELSVISEVYEGISKTIPAIDSGKESPNHNFELRLRPEILFASGFES